MAFKQILILFVSVWLVSGQRPSFAGTKPIGYPELVDKPKDPLGNRFGEDLVLPIEAKGDRDLVERISKLPIDQQPFWYINWKALEEQRKNPQTYQERPNSFVDTNVNQIQSVPTNSNNLSSRFDSGTSQATNVNQMSSVPTNSNNLSSRFDSGTSQATNGNNGNNFAQNKQNYRIRHRY